MYDAHENLDLPTFIGLCSGLSKLYFTLILYIMLRVRSMRYAVCTCVRSVIIICRHAVEFVWAQNLL